MTWRERHLRRVRALEDAAAEVVVRELDRVLDRIAEGFGAVVAAAEDEPAANAGTPDDLSAIGPAWTSAVDGEVLPWFDRVYHEGGLAAVEQVEETTGRAVSPVPEVAPGVPSLMDEAAARHLADARPRFTALGDAAWTRARAELVDGIAAGDDLGRMRRRLREVTDLTRAQADQVARTEVIAATNAGSITRVRLMGADAPPFKQWLATMDARTRPTHAAADGQVVPREGRFEVGAAMLDYPADYTGPAAEVINCRCTILFVDSPEALVVEGRQEGGVVDQMDVPPSLVNGRDPDRWASGGVAVLERVGAPAEPEVAHQVGHHNQKAHGRGAHSAGSFEPDEFKTDAGGFSVKKAKAYQKDAWGGGGGGAAGDGGGDWNADLTPQQRRVVQDYAGDSTFSHYAMNAFLRGKPGRGGRPVPKRSVERKIINMDGAFRHESAKVPTDLEVHRGVTGDMGRSLNEWHRQGKLFNEHGGAKWNDKGFVSTSMDRRQAAVFGREGNKGERAIVTYRLRAGDRGIAPSQTGSLGARHANELEVILPRNQWYEVMDSRMGTDGALHVTVEVSSAPGT
jgi:hypothetical protein